MLRWLPEDVSTFGQEIDSLFYLIYYITAVDVHSGHGFDDLVSDPVPSP